jgi:restriction system protein
MTVWLNRAGRHGENEEFALQHNVVLEGSRKLADLSKTKTREDIRKILEQERPDAKPKSREAWARQLYTFVHKMKKGDVVVLPLKTRSAIAIGRVTGDYAYRNDFPEGPMHTRPVEWLRTDIPRTAFDQDILYSLGASLTVCQIKRNNAEERIMAILEGKGNYPEKHTKEQESEPPEEPPDFAESARDQIRDHVSHNFKGRDMERLVSEVLKAQGYQVQQVPLGPDGGIDIIAGRGPMGFDPPKLGVQVKSSDSPVDVGVLRELKGTLNKFGADQGLLVSWGGFKASVEKEAREIFFHIRLWDSNDLLAAIFENYEKLSADLQAEIPLKRIWTLVLSEDSE